MVSILEKLKKFGTSIKKSAQSTAKTIAQKTPEAAETLTKKTKSLASEIADRAPEMADKTKKAAASVAEKAEEAVSNTKLKMKIHNLNRKVEKELGELGAHAFELISKGKTDIADNSSVESLLETIENLKMEIMDTERLLNDPAKEMEKTEIE